MGIYITTDEKYGKIMAALGRISGTVCACDRMSDEAKRMVDEAVQVIAGELTEKPEPPKGEAQ